MLLDQKGSFGPSKTSPNFKVSVKSYYAFMKKSEPKLYWTKVLRLIANDLNGDWKPEVYKEKWFIAQHGHKNYWNNWSFDFKVCKHVTVDYGQIFFESKSKAEKAVDIMSNNLEYLFIN
jgi:glucose/arabinose dehydrogenase